MPNIVFNTITFETQEQYDSFCAMGDKSNGFSFEWIVPSPKTREECDEEYLIAEKGEKSAAAMGISPKKERPWFNWYKWQCENWGTKWDAYDDLDENDEHTGFFRDEQRTIAFNTAWSPPFPVYQRMAELSLAFNFSWLSEPYGGTSGKGHSEDGEIVIDEEYEEEDDEE